MEISSRRPRSVSGDDRGPKSETEWHKCCLVRKIRVRGTDKVPRGFREGFSSSAAVQIQHFGRVVFTHRRLKSTAEFVSCASRFSAHNTFLS
jgi:hypothetical protein